MSTNPWESDPAFINVGGLKHILSVNKRFSTYETSGQTSNIKHSSVEFIDLLQELSRLNHEQTKVNIELQTKKLYDEFYNVLHTDVLDGLISMIDYLSNQLQQIIENKELIVDRLHKPFVGQYVAMDSQYHGELCDFFPQVANNLANLTKVLTNIEWIHKYSVRNSDISNTLEMIMSTLSTLQKQYQAMNETRDLMNDLLKIKE